MQGTKDAISVSSGVYLSRRQGFQVKRGVTWENNGKLNTRRAAAFWKLCKDLIVEPGSPARRELQ